jgi:hypothetical protein
LRLQGITGEKENVMASRKFYFFIFLIYQAVNITIEGNGFDPGVDNRKSTEKYSLEDLSFSLNSSLSPSNHLWVMSGWSTVTPLPNTVMGTGECIGPPLAGMDFRMSVTLEANGHKIPDNGSTGKGDVGLLYSGGNWRPDRITRSGTYHYLVNNDLISFSVRSDLVPLYGKTGFVLKVIISNRADKILKIRLNPEVFPGNPSVNPLSGWSYVRPPGGKGAKPEGENRWSNDDVNIDLIKGSSGSSIPVNESDTLYLGVTFSQRGSDAPSGMNLKKWEEESENAWNDRLSRTLKNLPELSSDIPGLDDYYKRSIVSGLVCIWENPSFILNPYISTLGIDGGGLCAYLWDIGGYIPQILTLMLGDDIVKYAKAMQSVNPERYYAYTLDGSGVGVSYSYSVWSFVHLVWNIWKQRGPDTALYDEAKRLVMDCEKRQSDANGLIDFGVQENLLEMRSAGWEHFVASPNAERAWCLDRLADMAERAGTDIPQAALWRKMASAIRYAVQKTLWNPQKKWFDCLYPDGHRETVYSIQVYDALRAGACTKEMEKDLVSHLREGAFLFPYGISSISAEDVVHYEVNDPDWSGAGIYIGDGAEIAMTMYETGRFDLAWDILKRHFWMGKHLAYYPQEHYVDRPAVPSHKRANEISGLNGAQVILYGMAGFDHRIDGSLWINPHFPENTCIALKGYGWKMKNIDLLYSNNKITVFLDDRKIYHGRQKNIRII